MSARLLHVRNALSFYILPMPFRAHWWQLTMGAAGAHRWAEVTAVHLSLSPASLLYIPIVGWASGGIENVFFLYHVLAGKLTSIQGACHVNQRCLYILHIFV
ncbi:hypothetical protein GDO78_019559 [Eleutherodactylus coqui]|uniref:Uncharacterized protein n=1 Tax=Eleutherodactylus coqui TaxID=57060 RepID=A0A8J6ECG9_ELECQ|nr:hypothetical protein GDO78_019559 [Eleutherodactylus coqui]